MAVPTSDANMRLDPTARKLFAMGLIGSSTDQPNPAPKPSKASELLTKLESRVTASKGSEARKITIKPKTPRPRVEAEESESEDESDTESENESESDSAVESETDDDDDHEKKAEPERKQDTNWSLRVNTIKDFTESKLKEHGLAAQGWKLKWNRRLKSTGGRCCYRNRLLEIGVLYLSKATDADVKDTVLHEIAHALTPGHKHDQVWRHKALLIGCTGMRCHTVKMKAFNWLLRCPSGCSSYPRTSNRAGKKGHKCPVCDQPIKIVSTSVLKQGK
jgi:predicted SprT family Zn-dependent metalloprotease